MCSYCFFCAVCMCGEFGDSCGGYVPQDLPSGLPPGASDLGHVRSVLHDRIDYADGGNISI